ncbi:NlpC/P60 family protein [Streptomyces sp. NPDC019990]|uniref:C40 family peptidase n=1 Tax=Streptomyces sp. NPDC019990 TaxID=3154693 RepID=UPI0033F3E725
MENESAGPSPDEVQRYINSLYDRAESDTGRFNPTRAAAIPRQRGTADRSRFQEDAEPAAGTLARKWFDVARAKLGPTVPATLPGRRPPADRALESARPARPTERPAEPLALEAPKAPAGVARELTGGAVPAPATAILPEIPTQRVAPALPGESRSSRADESARREDAPAILGGDTAAWPSREPEPAPVPEPIPLARASGMEAYGAGPATGATATYAAAPPAADPTPYYAPGPPAGLTSTVMTPGVDVTPVVDVIRPVDVTSAAGMAAAADVTTAVGVTGAARAMGVTTAMGVTGVTTAMDVTSATYAAGLQAVPAPALTASAPAPAVPAEPATALAFTAPVGAAAWSAPDALTASEPPSTPLSPPLTRLTPGAYGGSWLSPDAGHNARTARADRVIAFARAQIGRPCVWGAVGPGSYDAPGLTQAAWRAAGVTLPRTTQAQWEAGVQVSLADAQAGDLVFFHDDLGHVGIWSGDGMMIHAPGPGALIREESVFFAGQPAIKGVVRPA